MCSGGPGDTTNDVQPVGLDGLMHRLEDASWLRPGDVLGPPEPHSLVLGDHVVLTSNGIMYP